MSWLSELLHCKCCDVYREQLAIANDEKRRLLQALLQPSNTEPVIPEEQADYKSVKPRFQLWSVRQAALEAEDRKAAELKKNHDEYTQSLKQSTDDLEKELGIHADGKSDNVA